MDADSNPLSYFDLISYFLIACIISVIAVLGYTFAVRRPREARKYDIHTREQEQGSKVLPTDAARESAPGKFIQTESQPIPIH